MSTISPDLHLPTLSPEFFDFIASHINGDPIKLRLSLHDKATNFDVDFALTQIESRKKCSRKLKNFIQNKKFLFPSTLSAEQASHQAVAQFHASLLSDCTLLDMTAGLGIDAMTMAENASEAVAIELDPLKAATLKYDSELLGKRNLEVINADSVDWLEKSDRRFDIIFIDPARRKEDNSRAYNFHDCLPDIIALQDSLLNRSKHLIIKASPLLDVTQTLKDIRNVTAIRALCVQGECKEILVEASRHDNTSANLSLTPILYEAIDLNEAGAIISRFSYSSQPESPAPAPETEPSYASETLPSYASESDLSNGSYLYEPNAAVMKLAPWKELSTKFPSLKKLAPSSHLFTSPELYPEFPGRVLRIERVIEKKDRKSLKGLPVNVAVRNYPLSVAELRKTLKVKEGKDHFLYGTTLSKPILILAERVLSTERV